MIKSIYRHILIFLNYPKLALLLFLKLLCKLFFFKYSLIRDNQKILKNKILKKKNSLDLGHAIIDKKYKFYLFNYQICSISIREGNELTAEHFFLNRPINDLLYLIQKTRHLISFNSKSIIFDPGCGTGKHLIYFNDKYFSKCIGVDIYSPAIKIANLIKLNSDKINFYNHSSLDIDFIKNLLPNGCDFIFINSWLNHVSHHKDFHFLCLYLIKSCKYLLLINSSKYKIQDFFKNVDVLFEEVKLKKNNLDVGVRFALIKGKKN